MKAISAMGAAGSSKEPPAASSGRYSSTKATIQASSANRGELFNGLLVARPHARLLVDDYAGRDHYRVLADFLDLRRMIGRMAEFTPLATPHPGLDQAILAHAADWR